MTARHRPPNQRGHDVFAFENDGQRYVAGVGTFAAHAAILLSFALQQGGDLAAIRYALIRSSNGKPGGPLSDPPAGES